MEGWSNKRPEEEGYFWVVTQYFIDGDLKNTEGPEIWYIDPNGKYGCCAQLGTDDPSEIPDGEDLIDEVEGLRDLVYCWDNLVTADKKRKDKVNHKWMYWIKPIPEATFSEQFPVDAYPETHQEGILSIEKAFSTGMHSCDVGIQIAPDGRIWLCVNGEAYIRFKPRKDKI